MPDSLLENWESGQNAQMSILSVGLARDQSDQGINNWSDNVRDMGFPIKSLTKVILLFCNLQYVQQVHVLLLDV